MQSKPRAWHVSCSYLAGLTQSSITFERVPSDYAILKIVQKPEDAGGDTLWASGYEAYDRLSPTWQKFADGLTATHSQVRIQPSLLTPRHVVLTWLDKKAYLQQNRQRARP